MKDSNRYLKIVEWSEEDQCYVGAAPGLFFGGCHGDNELEVFKALCALVEDTVNELKKSGTPLPPPTAGRHLGDKVRSAA